MQIRAHAEQESGTVFVDVYYTELASSPLESVERIYYALGLTLSPEARSNMRTWMAHHPQHRHGVHRYSLTEFCVDANEIAGLFRNYLHGFYTPSAHPRTNVTRQLNLSTD